MIDKFVIIDLQNMEVMKDIDGNIKYYDTFEVAGLDCGMYEFENVWICKLIYNYIDKEHE